MPAWLPVPGVWVHSLGSLDAMSTRQSETLKTPLEPNSEGLCQHQSKHHRPRNEALAKQCLCTARDAAYQGVLGDTWSPSAGLCCGRGREPGGWGTPQPPCGQGGKALPFPRLSHEQWAVSSQFRTLQLLLPSHTHGLGARRVPQHQHV